METKALFCIHRAPAFNGALRSYALYINAQTAGFVPNGGTLEYPAPEAPVYIIEKDGPFGPAVSLRGRGLCPLEIRTLGGCGAPNGQDEEVRTEFWLRDRQLRLLPLYETLRQARLDPAVRAELTEQQKPLFVACAFWKHFGQTLEMGDKLSVSGMDRAVEAFEQLGAPVTAAFCRDLEQRRLAPGVYDLPPQRPDFRAELTAAVHRYILQHDMA